MARLVSIILTAYLNSGAIQGEPGNVIEMTEENKSAAAKLLQDKGALAIYDVAAGKPPGIRRKVDDDGEADGDEADETEAGDEETTLADYEDGDSVDTLELSARHTKALQAAGLKTIADVRNCENLDALPNLSVAVVARIKGVLAL